MVGENVKTDKYEKQSGKIVHVIEEKDSSEVKDVNAEIAKLEGLKSQYQASISNLNTAIKKLDDDVKFLKEK